MSEAFNTPDIGAFGQMLGFRVVKWRDGHVRMEMDIGPEHLNRSGVLHGGVISSLLDTACGYSGTWCTKQGNVRWAITVNLTTNFTGQAKSGTITTIGRKRGGGRKIFFASAEVQDENGQVLGFGDSVQRYRTGCEDPEGIPYKPPV
ncbi:MAG: PaaI family thioesterase [Alphaproteobacteria bacterium]|nr:PaaI family thioesterase [Alphaproteobacteria bacterium]